MLWKIEGDGFRPENCLEEVGANSAPTNSYIAFFNEDNTMAKPSTADIKKKEDFKKSLIKTIGGDKLSDKKMCTILRSSVRQTWMMSPVRLLKLEMGRIADMNESTRTKWLIECEHCNNKFKMTDVEVDHVKGEHKLLTLSDVEGFARSILDVTLNDLQIICKPCHALKTYSERYDVSIEYARTELKVIEWLKVNKTPKQSEFLLSVGFEKGEITNPSKRRDAYRTYLNC